MAVPGVQIVDSAGNSVTVAGGNVPIAGTVTTVAGGSGASASQASSTLSTSSTAGVALAAGAHRLFAVYCTVTGTNAATTITDGPGGTVIAVIPAAMTAGSVVNVPNGGIPTVNSIYYNGVAGSPTLTVIYS